MIKTSDIFKNTVKDIFRDDCQGMASEIAFNFILALFPFAIFIAAIFGLLGTSNIIDDIINALSIIAPSNVLKLLENVLSGIIHSSTGGLLTIGLLGSIWAASNAAMVIMKSLNRAYNATETRPFWQTRGLAILIILMIALIMFIAANIIIFGELIINFIDRKLYVPDNIINTVLLIRWPVIFLTLFVVLLIMYYFMPNIDVDRKTKILSSLPGALFFCVFWLIASWAFSLYVENFGRYNAVYGTLGGVIVLLIWLYYTSLIILVGGEINSEIYRQLRPKIVETQS